MLYLLRTFGLRGPGIVVAALAYMLTPYTLDYAARISVLLMPWAALPWMIGLMRKALKDGGWRYPAIFALVVQSSAASTRPRWSSPASVPLLWIVYSWLVAREVQWRRALGVAAKTGVLTIVTSLWWIAGLAIQGGYGLDILKYTETVEAVARTSTPNEILRGLGYWFFYGQDRLGPWIEASSNYTQRPVVIIAGYTLVALALLAAGFVRWRHRVFFVGAVRRRRRHRGRRASVRRARRRSARCSRRSPTARPPGSRCGAPARAVPLVVLGLAVLLGVGDERGVHRAARATRGRCSRRRASASSSCCCSINFPALVRRHVLRQEPATTRGHPAVLERRGRATSTPAATTRVCSSCRAPTSRRTGGATPSTRSRPG